MNSYLLELLANDKAEAWCREARGAQLLGCSRLPALKALGRLTRLRRLINGAGEASHLVDCR
jgi:hypothetical protein